VAVSEGESIPAATVVPLRDGPSGLETLMLRKNSKLAFGGMWVFPGGRVDDADGPGDELTVARRAAVREAREEAAVAIDAADLVAFSHWTPPRGAPRRFLTWFFLAPVHHEVDVVIDTGEIQDHGWLSPGDALARRDAGEYELAPPTWMTLRRLARAADVDAALAEARDTDPERYATRVVVDGPIVACLWEGDAGYPDGDGTRPGPRNRLILDPAGWRYEGGAATS
jgi:8-oxo-dGTP pyrophosphatase MutT (NUDIX family)